MPDVARCSVNPNTIALGGQSTLTVTLTAAAPSGGQTVAINTTFNGSEDTLLSLPQSIGVAEGETESTFLIQTQKIDGAASTVIFEAFIGNGARKADELYINSQ